jgi:hypothetical protein
MTPKRKNLIDRLASFPESLLDEVEESLDEIARGHVGHDSNAARRHRAWGGLQQLFERLRTRNPDTAQSPEEIREEEERIAEDISLMRRRQRHV